MPVLCPAYFSKVGPLPKQRGEVRWFDIRKRYGFIVAEKGQEIFFHQRQIIGDNGNDVREGQVARFHVCYTEKGPEALKEGL